MTKPKSAKPSKPARSSAVAMRAHGKKQTVVKSVRDNLLRSVATRAIESSVEIQEEPPKVEHNVLSSAAARPIESSLELHDNPKEEAHKVEKQEAHIAASPVQVGRSQMRGFDFASATENMVAYQGKLLEMTQANMQISLDFSQKLATIRSPFQFVDVIVEFAKRRADMLAKQSTEMAALTRR
jgi:hypothetical protein